MASSREPSLQSQMAEKRWNRARAISIRSCQGDAAPPRRPLAEVTEPPRRTIDWRWWGGRSAAVVGLGLLLYGANAWLSRPSAADLKSGEELFSHKWVMGDPLSKGGDGLGPVFNARSCVDCHFQGGVGGGGDLAHNVAAFEVLPTLGHPDPGGGVVHAFATREDLQESRDTARTVFPIIPKGAVITAVCKSPLTVDYDPLHHLSINTPTLLGSGQIDRISGSAIRAQHARQMLAGVQKELNLDFKKAGSGRVRVLPDGRIGKFGWKAQFATLEEFVANACAVEVGLTTPTRKQHLPKQHREDETAKPDLDRRQFRQLVAFVASLPAPRRAASADVSRGRDLFASVGCADCHAPELGGVAGLYSDLCLHDLSDQVSSGYTVNPQVPLPDDYPLPSEWKTPPLWGVAQTAPYLHDGSAPTLDAAIQGHGGQARDVRQKYNDLRQEDRDAVVAFLTSLGS